MVTEPHRQIWRFAQASEEQRQFELQQAVRRHLPHSFSLSPEQSSRFRGRIDRYVIGDVLLLDTMATSFEAARGRRQIDSTDDSYISLMHMKRGEKLIEIGDREYDLGPGDVLAFDSGSTHRVRVPRQLAKSQLTVRKSHMRDLGVRWDNKDGVLLRGSAASVGFLIAYLELVKKTLSSSSLSDHTLRSLRNATVELTTAALRDPDAAPSSHSVRGAVLQAAQDHVRNHLGDPALSPASTAADLHVSVRTLNRAFNESGEPFTAYTRRMRLARARRDLLSMPPGVSIGDVAHRWCFTDASHFTRRFREQYGHTPKECATGRPGPA